MTVDRHDALEALLTDYVLGELDDAQRRDLEEHLRTCPRCAAEEVGGMREVFHLLALVPEPVTVPPRLRERVLADFNRLHPSALTAEAGSRASVRGGRFRAAPPSWLAAAAAIVLALGTLLALSHNRASGLADRLAQSQTDLAALQDRLEDLGGQADLAVSSSRQPTCDASPSPPATPRAAPPRTLTGLPSADS